MTDAFGFAEVGLGHNRERINIAETLRTRLELEHAEMCDRCNELTNAEGRLPAISDDETAGKISDYIKQIMAACKNAEGARIAAKEPHLEASRAVDGFFTKGIVDPLMALKRRVEAKLTRYLQEKAAREREARMEAERKAREAEAEARREADARAQALRTERDLETAVAAERAAHEASANRIAAAEAVNAKPAEMSRTRGDYGSVASLRTNWDYEVSDMAAVPRAYLMLNDAAVKAHMKARLKDQPPAPIAGINFYEKTSAAVR